MEIDSKLVNDLRKKLKELDTERNKVQKAIGALQEVCDHNWIADGHNSRDDHETCSICGKERWV